MINPVNSNYSYKNIKFTSRDECIRRAGDIAHQVNKAYPRVSPSVVLDYPNSDKFPELKKRYIEKIIQQRNKEAEKLYDLYCTGSLLDKIKVTPDLIRANKLGNCGESARLSALAAKINGIDDFCIGCLDSSDTGDLDHEVLIVNEGKKQYIIDSWLGFADYIPEAVNRYKSEYGYHFDLSGDESEVIEVLTYPSSTAARIKAADRRDLQEAFPELMLTSTKKEAETHSFLDKIKNFFGLGRNKKLNKTV